MKKEEGGTQEAVSGVKFSKTRMQGKIEGCKLFTNGRENHMSSELQQEKVLRKNNECFSDVHILKHWGCSSMAAGKHVTVLHP